MPSWLPFLSGPAAGGAALKGLELLFKAPANLKECNARVVREGRGFLWDKQVVIHPHKNGKVEVTPL